MPRQVHHERREDSFPLGLPEKSFREFFDHVFKAFLSKFNEKYFEIVI